MRNKSVDRNCASGVRLIDTSREQRHRDLNAVTNLFGLCTVELRARRDRRVESLSHPRSKGSSRSKCPQRPASITEGGHLNSRVLSRLANMSPFDCVLTWVSRGTHARNDAYLRARVSVVTGSSWTSPTSEMPRISQSKYAW